MPKRAYVSFQEVRNNVPIPDVLEKFGIADQFTRKGEVLTGCCPLPQHPAGLSRNHEQFKIDRKRGVWLYKCFGDCNGQPHGGGDVISFVKAMTGYDDAHVRFWFADHFGDRLSLQKPRKEKPQETKTVDDAAERKSDSPSTEKPTTANVKKTTSDDNPAAAGLPLAPLSFFLKLDPDVDYLRRRGVTADLAKQYGCGLASRGMLTGYVCFPVYRWPKESESENPVGYVGRWPADLDDYPDDRPRYKAAFETGKAVFGLPQAMETPPGAPLICVEGAFKVLHLARCGFQAAVSTFSATVTDEQADILASTGRPIVLLFDGNEAAYAAMRIAAGKLITRTFTRVVKLPTNVEPDDLDAAQLASLLP